MTLTSAFTGRLGKAFGTGMSFPRTFGSATGVDVSTVTTSRKAYFSVSTGTAYTIPANTEITFDGTTWLSTNGNSPAGAKWWRCRFESSASFSADVTKTPTLGGANYPFTVTTKANNIWDDAAIWDDAVIWSE